MNKNNIMNKMRYLPLLLVLFWLSPAIASGFSEQAVEHSSEAASHGSVGAASAIAASGQAASVIVAVPLAVTGAVVEAVGDASSSSAEKLAEIGSSKKGLEISDDSVTAGAPPNEAMKIGHTE
ncbi:MAG: hypothetical protein R8K21_08970 [Mariprofundales bacterium]